MRLSIFVVLLLHTFTSISGQNQLKFSLKDCILDRTTTNFMKVYSSDTIKNVIELYEAFEREMINAEILNNNSKKGYIKLLNNFASFDFYLIKNIIYLNYFYYLFWNHQMINFLIHHIHHFTVF